MILNAIVSKLNTLKSELYPYGVDVTFKVSNEKVIKVDSNVKSFSSGLLKTGELSTFKDVFVAREEILPWSTPKKVYAVGLGNDGMLYALVIDQSTAPSYKILDKIPFANYNTVGGVKRIYVYVRPYDYDPATDTMQAAIFVLANNGNFYDFSVTNNKLTLQRFDSGVNDAFLLDTTGFSSYSDASLNTKVIVYYKNLSDTSATIYAKQLYYCYEVYDFGSRRTTYDYNSPYKGVYRQYTLSSKIIWTDGFGYETADGFMYRIPLVTFINNPNFYWYPGNDGEAIYTYYTYDKPQLLRYFPSYILPSGLRFGFRFINTYYGWMGSYYWYKALSIGLSQYSLKNTSLTIRTPDGNYKTIFGSFEVTGLYSVEYEAAGYPSGYKEPYAHGTSYMPELCEFYQLDPLYADGSAEYYNYNVKVYFNNNTLMCAYTKSFATTVNPGDPDVYGIKEYDIPNRTIDTNCSLIFVDGYNRYFASLSDWLLYKKGNNIYRLAYWNYWNPSNSNLTLYATDVPTESLNYSPAIQYFREDADNSVLYLSDTQGSNVTAGWGNYFAFSAIDKNFL